MATIRVLQAIGGLDFSWAPGDLVDLPDEEAAKWADGIRAEFADQAPPTPVTPAPPTPADDDPPPADPDDPGDGDDDPDLFNPADHNVKDVVAYLDGVGEEEAMRVLQLEENAEEPRKGIVGQRGSILERAQANDQATERAAEASRGGGRGDVVETR
ncbi:hypothetical protein ACFYQA_17315 [Streptomyces sp. NPDC005774]|uniref:hypothetical protein n=1 Tax=Streptomyces sp. NPDC005774 TaxID=3364728 RepID=UPI0036B98EB6